MKYYNMSVEEVMDSLKTSEKGLTSKQASNNILKYGKNELPKKKSPSVINIFFEQFKSPIEIILIITVIMSFLVGEVVDAITLIIIILVDVLIGTYEEWNALKEAIALVNMIKVTSKVIREGKVINIDSSLITIGDIVELSSGDKISCDARILECNNFVVSEAPLTGESVGVEKIKEKLEGDVYLAERKNMVYAGTSVSTGRAKVVVTAIGAQTEIGQIAENVNNTKEEKSPLTIRIERFSKQISLIILLIAFITFVILKLKGYQLNEILLSVVALSVSALPEGMQLALTMAFTIASKRMAKNNVVVKNLNAVESLGSCTVIVSDKTGL